MTPGRAAEEVEKQARASSLSIRQSRHQPHRRHGVPTRHLVMILTNHAATLEERARPAWRRTPSPGFKNANPSSSSQGNQGGIGTVIPRATE